MRQQFRQRWGLIVLGTAICVFGGLAFCESALQLHLRKIPRTILTWLGATAVCAFLAWADIQIRRSFKEKNTWWAGVIIGGVQLTSVLLSCALIFAALISSIMLRPEHEVQKNGVRMVARVNAFLDVYVDYYEYRGFLFYGKKLDSEHFGSGGYDPFADLPKTVPPENTEEQPDREITANRLNPQVTENRSGEFVFDVSIHDFIDCYNSLCRADQDNGILGPVSQWKRETQTAGIHSDYETVVYRFSGDEAIHSLPTFTVYTPSDCDAIQEITVDFDDHGYSEPLFGQYRKMCFYTIKAFFPGMPDDEISKLCTTLNTLANENLLSEEACFGHGAVPAALYYKDGVGVYPYFAVGDWSHLCIVPVNAEIIAQFEEKGVNLYEIEWQK